jgi:hypothetical protein
VTISLSLKNLQRLIKNKTVYPCLAFIIAAGCAQKSLYVQPTNRVDRTLYYYEEDIGGKKHPISSDVIDMNNFETRRIPDPAFVDIDSSIRIIVRKPPDDPAIEFAGEDAKQLLEEKKKLIGLFHSLDKLMDTRMKALKAHAAGGLSQELDGLISELSPRKIKFITEFRRLFPRGSKPYMAANSIIKNGGGLYALKPFIEEKLVAIRIGDKKIKEKAKSRSSKLRLEAFLDKSGKEELLAIHVKGYDSLPEQKLAARDRWGLNLSEVERAKLQKQINATEDLARTLDRVRHKEMTIQDGARDILKNTSQELSEQIVKAENLYGKLTDLERIEKVKTAIENVIRKAQEDAVKYTEAEIDKLKDVPETFMKELVEEVEPLENIIKLITEADYLARRWKQVDSLIDLEPIASLLIESNNLKKKIEKGFNNLPKWLQEASKRTETLLSHEFKNVQKEAMITIEDLINSEEIQALVVDVQGYYADIREGIKVIEEVKYILKIGKIPVEKVAPTLPEAFDVDINDLQDTTINLKKVPAQDRDSILLRATLFEPGRTTTVSDARFEITHYGWHAKLSPSVVLVKPNELESGNSNFQFAPALGWMHHYRPRPSATGFKAAFRPLQFSAGLHSIFLNFGDKSGIGLGGTISLWNDRLQLGVGYNLSADSKEEGSIYYFVGSDLIGLLQTIGIGGN